MRRRLHLRGLLCLVAAMLVVAGCGSDDTANKGSGGTAATSTPAATKIKVGLVTDIGGLNDRSFNQLANEGLERAKSELGVDGRVLTSKANSDYVPNLSTLAQQKYDLVIGVGFLMADAMNTVATKFPDTKFAIVDVDATLLKDKPTNVTGLLFAEQQAGYLAGYMAGLYVKGAGGDTIGSVGGQKIPPVDHYIAGYQAGAKAADPGIKTLNGYSQDFVDQAKC
jgi:basic membrane protein A